MGRYRRSAVVAGVTLSGLILVAGCSRGQAGASSGLDPFPAEKTAADFPGIDYPPQTGPIARPGSDAGPVWVVAVDGATWDMILPMVDRGALPNLASLLQSGAHGTLRAEAPTISPALWATIATGVPRFAHGVVNFVEKVPGRYEEVPAGPPDRRSPALWELIGAAGGRSAVASWFGSFPAERISGHYVSKGYDPDKQAEGQVHPPLFEPALKGQAVVKLRRRDLSEIGKSDYLRDTLLEDARTLAVLRVLAEQDEHDLVVSYFSGIDVVQHIAWRHMDASTPSFPGDDPRDPALADLIPAYYRYIDHTIGEVLALAPADATVVLLSDHGGGPLTVQDAFQLRLELLLETIGLMDGPRGTVFAIDESYRHDKRIWLNLVGLESAGFIPLDQAQQQSRIVAARLDRLRTDTGAPLFEMIREHTGETGWQPGQPSLTVRFSPEALLAETVLDGDRETDFSTVRLRRSDVSGRHRPEGILLLRGPAIQPGPLAREANHYNIAPTVLHLLGLPQDDRMLALAPADGGVLEEAIAPAWLAAHPIRAVTSYPGTDRSGLLRGASAGEAAEDPTLDATMERLRSLGYVN